MPETEDTKSTRIETRMDHPHHLILFCQGQVNLTQFIKYPTQSEFCFRSCALMMASGPVQSIDLTVMMEAWLLIFLKNYEAINCTFTLFCSFGV